MRDHLGRVIDNLLTATETDAIERARAEASELRARAVRVAAG
jgi:GntR family transcriptional repressor for pyruvate dehydrogenase complex